MKSIYLTLFLLSILFIITNGYPHFDYQQDLQNLDPIENEEDDDYTDRHNSITEPEARTTPAMQLADGVTPEPTLDAADEYLRKATPQHQFEALLFSYQTGLLVQFHENLRRGLPSKTEGGPNGTDCIAEQKARRVKICPIRCIYDFDDWFPVAGCGGPLKLNDSTIEYMCCPSWVKIETPEPELKLESEQESEHEPESSMDPEMEPEHVSESEHEQEDKKDM